MAPSTTTLEFSHEDDLHMLRLRLVQLERQVAERLDRLVGMIPGQGRPADPLADDPDGPLRRYLLHEVTAMQSDVDYLDWAQAAARVDRSDQPTAVRDLGERISRTYATLLDLDRRIWEDPAVRHEAKGSVARNFAQARARRRHLSLAWASPGIFLATGLAASQSMPLLIAAACCSLAIAMVGSRHVDREFERMLGIAEERQSRYDRLDTL